jgi:hypothetical protein
LYGSGQLTSQFHGFFASMSAAATQGFGNTVYNDRSADVSVDTISRPLFGKFLSQSIGVTSSYERFESPLSTLVREGTGVRYRLRTSPLNFGLGTMNASVALSKLWGREAGDGIGVLGSLSSSLRLGKSSTLAVNYDYMQAQLSSSFLGKQRLSASLYGKVGALGGSLFVSRSLDVPYTTLFADSSLRLSKTWRIGYSYTLDRYLLSSFEDYSILLGFNAGLREIGIRWSHLTHRFSIELMAAPF